MSKDVNFKINLQIDGKDKVVQASTSVKELGKAVRDTKSEAERGFNLTSFANLTVSLKNVADIAAQLHSQLNGLYTAYQAQISAETTLSTVMKQRMGASEQDVQSILRLTAARNNNSTSKPPSRTDTKSHPHTSQKNTAYRLENPSADSNSLQKTHKNLFSTEPRRLRGATQTIRPNPPN